MQCLNCPLRTRLSSCAACTSNIPMRTLLLLASRRFTWLHGLVDLLHKQPEALPIDAVSTFATAKYHRLILLLLRRYVVLSYGSDGGFQKIGALFRSPTNKGHNMLEAPTNHSKTSNIEPSNPSIRIYIKLGSPLTRILYSSYRFPLRGPLAPWWPDQTPSSLEDGAEARRTKNDFPRRSRPQVWSPVLHWAAWLWAKPRLSLGLLKGWCSLRHRRAPMWLLEPIRSGSLDDYGIDWAKARKQLPSDLGHKAPWCFGGNGSICLVSPEDTDSIVPQYSPHYNP